MYLIYLDDSAWGKKRQLLGAVILNDQEFMLAEGYMGYIIEQHVPEEQRATFEFHASELWHGSGPFDCIPQEERIRIYQKCISMVVQNKIAVLYSCVEMEKVKQSVYATANPIDVAFRLLLPEIEKWFLQFAPNALGIVICDDFKDGKCKQQMQNTFSEKRPKIQTHVEKEDGKIVKVTENRGDLPHIHDGMYFGNSGHSVGIQLADMCTYIIQRHLKGEEDTEDLYGALEPLIYSKTHEPKL